MLIPELVQLWDKTTRAAIDSTNNAVVTIVSEHYRIHQGTLFTCTDKVTVADTATLYYLLDNPADNFPHLRKYAFASTAAPCDVYLFEEPTITANGTERTPYNNNRTSSGLANLKIYNGPTVTDDGTEIDYALVTGAKKEGGIATDMVIEWILNAGTKYITKFVNNSGSSATVRPIFIWYE